LSWLGQTVQGGNEAKGEGETQRHRGRLPLSPCAARVIIIIIIIKIILKIIL
jgi:hypothetical protein